MLWLLPVCGGSIDLHIGVLHIELLETEIFKCLGVGSDNLLRSHCSEKIERALGLMTTHVSRGSSGFDFQRRLREIATAEGE